MKQIRILPQCNLIHLIPAGVLLRFVLVSLYINIKNFIKKWGEKKKRPLLKYTAIEYEERGARSGCFAEKYFTKKYCR